VGPQFRVLAPVRLGCEGHPLNILKKIWRTVYGAWMRFAHVLGIVNRFILMTVFYWVIIDITNLVLRLFRIDLLNRRLRPQPSYWNSRPPGSGGTYRHQF
jgi:hypothetical protein